MNEQDLIRIIEGGEDSFTDFKRDIKEHSGREPEFDLNDQQFLMRL